MKKLILVFAIFLAFAVKSFAYTGSTSYTLYQVGYFSETFTMDCQSAGGNMGGFNPGFVQVYFYANDAAPLYHSWSYDGNSYTHSGSGYGSGDSFYWIHSIHECRVDIAVYQTLNSGLPNGVNLSWFD